MWMQHRHTWKTTSIALVLTQCIARVEPPWLHTRVGVAIGSYVHVHEILNWYSIIILYNNSIIIQYNNRHHHLCDELYRQPETWSNKSGNRIHFALSNVVDRAHVTHTLWPVASLPVKLQEPIGTAPALLEVGTLGRARSLHTSQGGGPSPWQLIGVGVLPAMHFATNWLNILIKWCSHQLSCDIHISLLYEVNWRSRTDPFKFPLEGGPP